MTELVQSESFIVIIAITLGCLTGIVGIIGCTGSGVMRTKAMEQTKLAMAAYVAEGSIDPDKVFEMLKAGIPKWEMPDPKT